MAALRGFLLSTVARRSGRGLRSLGPIPIPLTLATHLDAAAWARIRSALALAHGNQTAAARALGCHRNRLRDAIARLNLTTEAATYTRATRQPRGR